MILPPLPQDYENKPWDYKGPIWIESQMQAYGEACIAAYKAIVTKRNTHRKFNDDQVCEIRKLYARHHYPYKQVYRLYPMSEVTFIKIVKHRGAYK